MWRLEGQTASLDSPHVSLHLDLAQGDRGGVLRDAGGTDLARIWGLPSLQDLPLTDAYVREKDLVASFAPGPSFPFYTQVYWTWQSLALRPAPHLALSLLVSVRTDLLDTHPEFDVLTRVSPAAAIEQAALAGGQLFWGDLSPAAKLVDFARDADCAAQRLTQQAGEEQLIERRLFSEFLEKGVIRRARLFVAVVPADFSNQQVVAIGNELASTAVPLTV